MKKRNIAAAILLASMMAVSTCAVSLMTAVAANDASITINQAANDAAEHSYTAYPIFTGTLTTEGTNKVLSNLVWAETAVDKDKFVQALYAFDSTTFASLRTGTEGSYTYVTDAAKVAKALNEFSGDTQNLAKVFNTADVLKSAGGVALNKATDDTTGAITYSKSGLADGWYVVIDSIDTTAKTPNNTTGTTNVRSANLLQIVGDTTAGPKYSVPTLTKEIVEGSTTTKANQASIGDTVTYKITVPVPDMTGYNKYYYYVEDKLSPGLTFGSISSVVIENGAGTAVDKTLTPDDATVNPSQTDYYYLEKTESNGTTDTELKIVFEDCLETFKGQTGNIVITYTATLNDKAVITDEGNPNQARLVYSNDPNADYSGDTDDKPDEPDGPSSGQVTGGTPWDEVKTYTTAVQIKKVDENGNPLPNVSFTLEGTNLKKLVVTTGVTFTEDASGNYWKLKSGLYTMTDPTKLDPTADAEALSEYNSTTTKYKRTNTVTTSDATSGNSTMKVTGTVDSTTGVLTFSGLGAGTYKLVETNYPAGYNKAPDVEFTIGNYPVPDATSAHWTNSNNNFSIEDNMYTITIQNTKGTTLPSTGGIGTTIFYVVGGTLVAGAVVLLITKKRMSINDQK